VLFDLENNAELLARLSKNLRELGWDISILKGEAIAAGWHDLVDRLVYVARDVSRSLDVVRVLSSRPEFDPSPRRQFAHPGEVPPNAQPKRTKSNEPPTHE
jgi:hypothetical protein